MRAGNSVTGRNFRANSLRIYFGAGTTMPNDAEIFGFFRKLDFKAESLKAMYKEVKEFSIYAMFKTEEDMLSALAKAGGSVTFNYANGQSVMVTVSVAGCTVKYVRLFGLPPDIFDSEIEHVLSRYGKIFRMVRERYGVETGFPIWNGVRGVHMEVTGDIPAMLHVLHFQARVYYDGLVNKCFLCGGSGHKKSECPKRISVNERLNPDTQNSSGEMLAAHAPISYKDAVSGHAGPSRGSSYTPVFEVLTSKPSVEVEKENETRKVQTPEGTNKEINTMEKDNEEITFNDAIGEVEGEQKEVSQAMVKVQEKLNEEWKIVQGRSLKRASSNKTDDSSSPEDTRSAVFKIPPAADLLSEQRTRSRSKHSKIDKSPPKRSGSAEKVSK